jgi:mono/diheme cytochrome c family protein
MGRLLLGILVGIVLAPALVFAWLRWGHPPVAVADAPLPAERALTRIPLHARIHNQMPPIAPIQPSEDNLVAGAQVYAQQCAACHGVHGRPSPFAAHMYPTAPPLWEKHRNRDVVGVSDDPVGETYWKVANGIRLTGMPAYRDILSDTRIWQVTLLLANADKPLPPAALRILTVPASAPFLAPAPFSTAPSR